LPVRGQHARERVDGGADRDLVQPDPEPARAVRSVVEAILARVSGGEHETAYAICAQSVRRHNRGKGRVHAAGKAQQHSGEAGLVHVVPKGRDKGVVDLARGVHSSGDGTSFGLPAIRPLGPANDAKGLLEERQAHDGPPLAVEGEGGAIKDQFILAADLVHINQGQPRLGHARPGDLRPLSFCCPAIRRPVRDHQDLSALIDQRRTD